MLEADFPILKTVYTGAFYNCTSLRSINMPQASVLQTYAFANCSALLEVSLPAMTNILSVAFSGCVNLISLYLMGSTRCVLSASTAFTSTPIGGYSDVAGRFGSIFVPASLYNAYITAASWSFFSSRFVSVE